MCAVDALALVVDGQDDGESRLERILPSPFSFPSLSLSSFLFLCLTIPHCRAGTTVEPAKGHRQLRIEKITNRTIVGFPPPSPSSLPSLVWNLLSGQLDEGPGLNAIVATWSGPE